MKNFLEFATKDLLLLLLLVVPMMLSLVGSSVSLKKNYGAIVDDPDWKKVINSISGMAFSGFLLIVLLHKTWESYAANIDSSTGKHETIWFGMLAFGAGTFLVVAIYILGRFIAHDFDFKGTFMPWDNGRKSADDYKKQAERCLNQIKRLQNKIDHDRLSKEEKEEAQKEKRELVKERDRHWDEIKKLEGESIREKKEVAPYVLCFLSSFSVRTFISYAFIAIIANAVIVYGEIKFAKQGVNASYSTTLLLSILSYWDIAIILIATAALFAYGMRLVIALADPGHPQGQSIVRKIKKRLNDKDE